MLIFLLILYMLILVWIMHIVKRSKGMDRYIVIVIDENGVESEYSGQEHKLYASAYCEYNKAISDPEVSDAKISRIEE